MAAKSAATPDPRFDWARIARTALASRTLDDLEELLNRSKATTPKEHIVQYQFSAKGHEVAQVILGSLLTGTRDAAGAYYRSRPLLLSLGLSLEDAHGSPLGRAGGFSDGRDIGVVCNLPRPDGGCTVLPMAGDVGSQYTPVAGWAQAITYHRDVLKDASYDRAIGVVLGGDGSVATNGFWSSLTMATTLNLPMLYYIEDNDLGISVRGAMQTPGANIAKNLASFGNLFIRDGDGTNPEETARLLAECVEYVRAGKGPALVRLTVPRLNSHSGPDNQKAYRTDEEIAADFKRDPLPKLKAYLVPAVMTARAWDEMVRSVEDEVKAAVDAARARPSPSAADVGRFVYGDDEQAVMGGMPAAERTRLRGTDVPAQGGTVLRFQEAVRRTIDVELAANPRVLVFGEDVGRKGGVHLVTEGLQKKYGATRVFDTSLSEEGIIGRASGMAIAGLVPVTEIQFRKYADPAAEQLNNLGTTRWRTRNRFAAPVVVRMPGGFGKDVGDPWHSLSDEVRFAHAYGWHVAVPSNASDAVGLLRAAMRGLDPAIFFEHRSLLMTSDGSAPYPGDDYVLPFGRAKVLQEGSNITVVTWGAMVHRCVEAAEKFGDAVELIDLRTVAPWDKACVLASVEKTGRCLVVHEDNMTAGFGAEIAATLASDAFWHLDAPVERLAPLDIPVAYHTDLLNAIVPTVERIGERIEALLAM